MKVEKLKNQTIKSVFEVTKMRNEKWNLQVNKHK